MRLRHREVVQVGDDASLTQRSADFDLETIIDGYAKTTGRAITELGASATNQALPQGFITTVKFVYVRVDGRVTVRFNGVGNTAYTLAPAVAGKTATLLMEADDVTSILLTNPSSTKAVKVEYALCGD